MAVQLSAGVVTNEIDLTLVVPGVDSSTGALAGLFRWGPIGHRTLVDSESTLVSLFGAPTNYNAETFFTGANFLAYTNSLEVVRAANVSGASPIVVASITSGNSILTTTSTINLANGMLVLATSNTSAIRVGTAVSIINSTAFSISGTSDAFGTDPTISLQMISNNAVFTAMANTGTVSNLAVQVVSSLDDFTTKFQNGNFDSNITYLAKWPGNIGNSLRIATCASANQFASNLDLTSAGSFTGNLVSTVSSNNVVITLGANALSNTFNVNTFSTFVSTVLNSMTVGDYITLGNTVIGTQNTNITAISNTTAISLGANAATTVNVSATNTTITTTSSAFTGLVNGQYIAVYSNVSSYRTLKIATVQDGNTVILAANAGITNTTASWATLSNTSVSINVSTRDIYRRSQNTSSSSLARAWEFATSFDTAPNQSSYVLYNGNTSAQDEIHIMVVDQDGWFTNAPGTILERYVGLSRATDAMTNNGLTNYYRTVINQNSKYVWSINDRSGQPSANAFNVASSTNYTPYSASFVYGADGADESTIEISTLTNAYDNFSSSEDSDVSLIMTGKARGGIMGEQLGNYIIDNIAQIRLDCVVFLSPDKNLVVNAPRLEADNCVAFRNASRNSSYAFMDSGYKYQYDKYNNVYRYVPLNGDIAGLAARTDSTNDPWWSFAGPNRGSIKNIVKLAWNPKKAYRDLLYKNSVNPVVTFNDGTGTLLYGDKTMTAKPSAFDRINVRRLFLVLEKSISRSAKYSLFEFNDSFTRAQFRNLVIPFLQEVQGKRGIIEFTVRCDGTNNTPEIVNTNRFVGDIFVVPNKSINYISLNFVAVPDGVTFTEAESVQF
jgi:hypothetical protein